MGDAVDDGLEFFIEQRSGAYMLSKYTEPDAVDRRRSFDPFVGCSVVLSREFSTATPTLCKRGSSGCFPCQKKDGCEACLLKRCDVHVVSTERSVNDRCLP